MNPWIAFALAVFVLGGGGYVVSKGVLIAWRIWVLREEQQERAAMLAALEKRRRYELENVVRFPR